MLNHPYHMLTQTNVRRLWHSFKRDLDIALGAELYRNKIIVHGLDQAVTPYFLRHTYCTSLFEIGIDLKTAQYLMGHASIKTTANIYTHFTERSLYKAGKTIREKLAGGQKREACSVSATGRVLSGIRMIGGDSNCCLNTRRLYVVVFIWMIA